MIKRVILSLTLVASSLYGAAQTTASEILARAEQSMYSGGAAVADFTSAYYDRKGAETASFAGRMHLQSENFRLEYGANIATFAGGLLSHYNKDEDTLTLSEPTTEELLQINPLYFLRARGKGFTVRVMPQTKTAHVISFVPTGKSGLRSAEISFLRASGLPSEVVVVGTDGGRLVVRIGHIRRTVALPAAQFVLSAKQFPGCEVVDLR